MNAKAIEVGQDYRLAGQEGWIVRVVERNGSSIEVELLQCEGTPKTNEKVGDHVSVKARELSPIEVGAAVKDKKGKRPKVSRARSNRQQAYSFHPLCKLFPPLPPDELQALADDIKQNGLRHPVLLHEGKVIDGKNRLEACQIAGVQPVCEEWDGQGSLLDFVVLANLRRRHLTSAQLAALAVDLKPLYEKQAKERQRLSAGRGAKGDKASPAEKGKSSAHVAKVCGTNPRYVEIAEKIKKSKPTLLEQVRRGEMGLLEAHRAIKVPGKARATPLTPTGVCQFIHDLISQQYEVRRILDPCGADEGLTTPWTGSKVILFGKRRNAFFAHSKPIDCDLVLCRPPSASIEAYLKRIVALVPKTTPIALLTPVTFRSSNKSAEQRWRWLRDECPSITGIVTLPLNAFRQSCEVLLFNLGKLKAHYFLGNEYLPGGKLAKAEAA
jgi:hypothetical protein